MAKLEHCFFLFRKGMNDLTNLLVLMSKERSLRHECEAHHDKPACTKAAAMRGEIKTAKKIVENGRKGREECGRMDL
jgi:hypothetical protein